jgi:hypothetical protein
MSTGEAFSGFIEADINFPPTFKYDVLRYKRSKHYKSLKRLSRHLDVETPVHTKQLTEIEETAAAGALDEDRSDAEQEYDGEAVSVSSTLWTNHSRYAVDVDEEEREDYFDGGNSPRPNFSTGAIINKAAASAAVHKAKAKWMSLISSTSSSPSTPLFKKFKHHKSPQTDDKYIRYLDSPPPSLSSPRLTSSLPSSPPPEFQTLTFPPTPDMDDASRGESQNDKLLMPPRGSESGRTSSPLMSRAVSTKSMERLDSQADEDEDGKGVYDTSHKRRVPSWYVAARLDLASGADISQV